MGYQSGLSLTTADYCALVGANAGDAITSGTGAAAVGRNALGAVTTATNASALGNGAYLTGNFTNSAGIGAGSQPTADNQVWLGNADANTWTSNIYPKTDDTYDIGDGTHRFDDIYATNATIQTSDATEKTAPLPVDDKLLDAWSDVQIVAFQWLSSVRNKADAARVHHGVVAQQVRDVLASKGIDGTRYGLLCYDEWEDQIEEIWEPREWIETETIDVVHETEIDGKTVKIPSTQTHEIKRRCQLKTGTRVARAAGSMWGIRPVECMWVEAAWSRRELARSSERFSALEARLAKLEKPEKPAAKRL
jgi:hypothetical protein